MEKTSILDIKLDNLTTDQVIEKIREFLNSDKQHYIVLPYSEFIVRAQKDEEFKRILNESDLSICESKGLLIVARFLGQNLQENIYGVDLIRRISDSVQCSNNNIFLLGGTDNVLEETKRKLKGNIVGTENGYQDLGVVINTINKVKPNILFVGLGSPMQEKWIYYNLDKMPSVKVAIGVGGAFDFISGKIKRAPKFLQKNGLEWLWRFILQPKRVNRIYNATIKFSWFILKCKVLKK